jgi:hypothetical protein
LLGNANRQCCSEIFRVYFHFLLLGKGWKFWIPAASINFCVVPVQYQVWPQVIFSFATEVPLFFIVDIVHDDNIPYHNYLLHPSFTLLVW